MPNWGLTKEQRELQPWCLSSDLLAPCKTVTDPVHGDVYLTELEALLVDSPSMQRLRRVRQLGTTHLVYPGATHSRLSHSLGTLRAAQDILDAVWNSPANPQTKDLPGNLLGEWANAGSDVLNMEFARATVLARLGALLHDLCHVPLGHTIEDDLQILIAHDANEQRFSQLWSGLNPKAREAIEAAPGLLDELRVLIISKDDHAKQFVSEYPFVGDIVGNTICADLVDYIRRDHHNTGLPLALGTRFVDSFFVVPSDHPHFPKRMVISIEREGRRRNDIVSELVKYLRYRYELTERVLVHHAKTAADAMLGKMLELWHDDLWIAEARRWDSATLPTPGDLRLKLVIAEKSTVSQVRKDLDDRHPDREPPASSDVTKAVQKMIEDQFLARSDDGLLEFLASSGETSGSRRGSATRMLAKDLLDRKLYKILGHAGSREDQAIAEETYRKFASDPHDRRELEKGAATFAGLAHGWEVVVWLPSYKMRLKVADVLVQSAGSITPLSRVEHTSMEIVEQHQRLWGVTVYAPEAVRDNPIQSDAILAYIGDRTRLRFRRPDGSTVPSRQELAVEKVLAEIHGTTPSPAELLAVTAAASDQNGESSFESLVTAVWQAGVENDLIDARKRPIFPQVRAV
jgi:HD superfamily phosphohydrolase